MFKKKSYFVISIFLKLSKSTQILCEFLVCKNYNAIPWCIWLDGYKTEKPFNTAVVIIEHGYP